MRRQGWRDSIGDTTLRHSFPISSNNNRNISAIKNRFTLHGVMKIESLQPFHSLHLNIFLLKYVTCI